MFKENKFNKILFEVILVVIIAFLIILFLGEKSTPKILNFEISNMDQNYAAINSNISITFNRVMDRKSVEKDFNIQPTIKGSFVWVGRKVVFIPKEKLQYDTNYVVFIKNSKDSNGNIIGTTPNIEFKTKPRSVYFISEEDNTKGFLKKVSLDKKINTNIVEKSVDNYAISSDGKNIVYSSSNKVFNKDLITLKESAIDIPNPIGTFQYSKLEVQKLLYGPQYILILIYPHNQDNSIGNLILTYDLSTTELKIFSPKDKIDYTDTMLFTPDYLSIIYRDASRNYAYSNIKSGESTILGSFISVNGFDYKQNKLSLTDSDPTQPQFQYVGYIDNNNKKSILSDKFGFSEDPNFSAVTDKISYSTNQDMFEDFNLFGIAINDITNNTSKLLYFDKNYSAELSQWSPDDKFISFERYNHDLLKRSVSENRVIFNYVKPLYGEIVVINTETKQLIILSQKGKDIAWDN